MPRLTTLALDLGGNHVVAAGADALAAALRGMPNPRIPRHFEDSEGGEGA